MGYALEQLGQFDEAIVAYRQAIGQGADPQSRAYTALPALLEQQNQPPEPISVPAEGFTLEDLLLLADEQIQAGHWPAAIQLYRLALERDPNNWSVHLLLGEALTQNQETEAAIATYQHLIEQAPQGGYTAGAYNRLGAIYAQQGRWDDAIASFRQAIERHPGYADAFRNLADAIALQGDWEAAVAAYEPYLTLYETGDVYNDYGDFLTAHEHWDEAITAYQTAIERDPNFIPAYLGLGYALAQGQQFDAALQTYQQLIDWFPTPSAYNGLGMVLLETGDRPAAIEAFRAGLILDPDDVELQNNLSNAENP